MTLQSTTDPSSIIAARGTSIQEVWFRTVHGDTDLTDKVRQEEGSKGPRAQVRTKAARNVSVSVNNRNEGSDLSH